MLELLNLLQLLLYIPMLALLGQAVLHLLAGARRESNFFYQTLRLIARPFTYVVRRITPRQVADEHVPVVTFLLLVVLSFVVFAERGQLLCVELGLEGCPR